MQIQAKQSSLTFQELVHSFFKAVSTVSLLLLLLLFQANFTLRQKNAKQKSIQLHLI